MQSSRLPLSVWFWGAYLVTTQTPGQSALQFQRQLGLKRYETAFQMLHKLRAGLVRPERDTIGDQYPVEVDESFVGGRTKGEGRGVHHKAIVIGAIEVRPRKAPVKGARRTFYAGRLRLRLVPNREAKSWTGYDDLEALGYVHKPLVIDGDPERIEAHLPMIHIAFSNLKSWLLGTHHGVSHRHLQAYLNEFVFRFNRRFYPMTAFNSALGLAAHASAPTYKKLYSSDWTHPAT